MNLVDDIIGLIVSRLKVAGLVLDLARLEARLFALTIVPQIVLVIFLFLLVVSLWISSLFLFGYFIYWLSNNFWVVLGSVIIFQILIGAGLVLWFLNNLKKMQFLKTRSFLKRKQIYEQETQGRIGNRENRKGALAKPGKNKSI